MPRALVGYRLVGFAGRLHLRDGIWDSRTDAGIIAAIESVNRRLDARHRIFIWRSAVENKSGSQIAAVGGKAESLTAAPAKAADEELAVRGRNLQGVIRRGIQIGRHLIRVQMAYGFHRLTFRKIAAAAAVRSHA